LERIARFYPEAMNTVKSSYGNPLAQSGHIEEAQRIAHEVEEAVKDKTESEKSSWYYLEFMIHYHSGDIDGHFRA
jgi:hypothetical protein